jgi:hypothetical protein
MPVFLIVVAVAWALIYAFVIAIQLAGVSGGGIVFG